MYIEQVYTNCLAEAAYYIESDGEAAVIDPLRDVSLFLKLAGDRNARIKYVFETHFHADFVSGHIDLARQTGAQIIYGPGAEAGYSILSAPDGAEFKLGSVTMRLLHTPGHTLESSCFLLLDENGVPHSVFTGDTLFVGDVGRPDLAAGTDVSREQLAGMLYDSIHAKLTGLPGYVIVYPGHGAGSMCGKALGRETFSTIGKQKETNYALRAQSKEEFIKLVTDGLTAPPKYFFMDAKINKAGYEPLDKILESNVVPLDINKFKRLSKEKNTLILDTRSPLEFSKEHIPGSVNVGLDGSFAVTAGSILDPESDLLIVAPSGRESESILRLARVGFEKVSGYLEGGIRSWVDSENETGFVASVTAAEFAERFRFNSCNVIDVRYAGEWIPGFVAGAKLIALPDLERNLNQIDRDKVCFVYCAGGYRSMVAASLMKKAGWKNVVNVEGGMNKISKTDIAIRQLSTIPG
jgi:hydroxyacylglutathione hydrolase